MAEEEKKEDENKEEEKKEDEKKQDPEYLKSELDKVIKQRDEAKRKDENFLKRLKLLKQNLLQHQRLMKLLLLKTV